MKIRLRVKYKKIAWWYHAKDTTVNRIHEFLCKYEHGPYLIGD